MNTQLHQSKNAASEKLSFNVYVKLKLSTEISILDWSKNL